MVDLSAGKPKIELLQLKEALEGHSNKPPDQETMAIDAEKGDTGKGVVGEI
jgi:hypothetical protein